MSYLLPQLSGAGNSVDNLGRNVTDYQRGAHSVYTEPSGSSLTQLGSIIRTTSIPRIICMHPNGLFAYILYSNNFDIAVFTINVQDGSLKFYSQKQLTSAVTYSTPVTAKIDPLGRYLYIAYNYSGSPYYAILETYIINTSDGSLTLSSTWNNTSTNEGINDFGIDPTGKFLYAGLSSSSTIKCFTIGLNGALTLQGSSAAYNSNPRAFAFHPKGKRVYCATAGSPFFSTPDVWGYINVFSHDPLTGLLTLLYITFIARWTYIHNIAISPDGSKLALGNNNYQTNLPSSWGTATDNYVYCYGLNANGDTIGSAKTAIPNPATLRPKQVTFDHTGKYLYVVMFDNSNAFINYTRIFSVDSNQNLTLLSTLNNDGGGSINLTFITYNPKFKCLYVVNDDNKSINQYLFYGPNITYDVYSFSLPGSASITFQSSVSNANILVCGAGGGGGSVIGGGGGGGDVLLQQDVTLSGTYTITNGNGGEGGIYNSAYLGGYSGEATTITGTNVNITAKGGGGGGGYNGGAYSGGWSMGTSLLGATNGGAHGGGYGAGSGAPIANGTGFWVGGGNSGNGNFGSSGGGAAGSGQIGTTTYAGLGAEGFYSNISGQYLSYGGGGGGGIRNGYAGGGLGFGGGGNGGFGPTPVSTLGGNGTRGGGGGGGGWNALSNWSHSGGKGSDGLVIISVPRVDSNTTSTVFGGSSSVSGYTPLSVIPVYSLGLSEKNPARNASEIYAAYGANGAVDGDYWYILNGVTVQLYTNFTKSITAGKGYVLVAKGREGTDWWNTSGQNYQYLINAETNRNPVAILHQDMVKQLAGTTTWNGMEFLINRFSGVNDSIRLQAGGILPFTWTLFTVGPNVANTASASVYHYSSSWLGGTQHYRTSPTTLWTDTYYCTGFLQTSILAVNDNRRSFTWTWDSHGGYQGWSAGSTITNGYVSSNNENHAIQLVNVFILS